MVRVVQRYSVELARNGSARLLPFGVFLLQAVLHRLLGAGERTQPEPGPSSSAVGQGAAGSLQWTAQQREGGARSLAALIWAALALRSLPLVAGTETGPVLARAGRWEAAGAPTPRMLGARAAGRRSRGRRRRGGNGGRARHARLAPAAPAAAPGKAPWSFGPTLTPPSCPGRAAREAGGCALKLGMLQRSPCNRPA